MLGGEAARVSAEPVCEKLDKHCKMLILLIEQYQALAKVSQTAPKPQPNRSQTAAVVSQTAPLLC